MQKEKEYDIKNLNIYCFFDDAAFLRYDSDDDNLKREFEGDRMERIFKSLGIKSYTIEKKTGCPDYQNIGHYDFVFFDFGAVSGVSDMWFGDYCRDFNKAIEDNLNTTFVLTSVLGNNWYNGDMNFNAPNLLKCGAIHESERDLELIKAILELDYQKIRECLIEKEGSVEDFNWFLRQNYNIPGISEKRE